MVGLLLLANCALPLATQTPSTTNSTIATTNNVTLLPAAPPPFETAGWRTDFAKRIVAWDEIRSGGPPRMASDRWTTPPLSRSPPPVNGY
ncbi:MAG: hypothetical protein R2867_09370 [Caldilineaceae bacterium]